MSSPSLIVSAKNSSFFIGPEPPDVVAKIIIVESTLKKLLFSGEIIEACGRTASILQVGGILWSAFP